MNEQKLSIVDELDKMVEQWDITPEPTLKITLAEVNNISSASKLLKLRAAEIDELNKLLDQLDSENGELKKHIAQQEADTREWQITIRQLQDQMDKMRRETVYLDRVREVIFMLQFALEAAKRAYAMPMDASAMLTAIWEQTRNELLYTVDDDIPF